MKKESIYLQSLLKSHNNGSTEEALKDQCRRSFIFFCSTFMHKIY